MRATKLTKQRILLISLCLAMALTNDGSLLIEVLSAIGSFSLWGAADSFPIERRVIKRRTMKTAQFLTMEVAFEDEWWYADAEDIRASRRFRLRAGKHAGGL